MSNFDKIKFGETYYKALGLAEAGAPWQERVDMAKAYVLMEFPQIEAWLAACAKAMREDRKPESHDEIMGQACSTEMAAQVKKWRREVGLKPKARNGNKPKPADSWVPEPSFDPAGMDAALALQLNEVAWFASDNLIGIEALVKALKARKSFAVHVYPNSACVLVDGQARTGTLIAVKRTA